MDKPEVIEIKFSIFKSALFFLGCILFVVLGIFFIVNPSKFVSPIMRNPTFIFIAGCAGVLFFGYVGYMFLSKLIENKPALILSADGITDNSSGLSAGFIPWTDIVAVEEQVVARARFLNLIVKNPQEYIERQTSRFKRRVMQKNYDRFGTNIGISTNTLKINFQQLKKTLEERISEERNRKI